MGSGSSTILDIVPYVISGIISIIISIISFLYTRHYVASISRRRIIRAIFRATKIEGTSASLQDLYDYILFFLLTIQISYLTVFTYLTILIVSLKPLHSMRVTIVLFLPVIYMVTYILLYMPYMKKIIVYTIFRDYKNNKSIYNISRDALNLYGIDLQKLNIFFTIYVSFVIFTIYQNNLYIDIINYLMLALLSIAVGIITSIYIRFYSSSKFKYKTDLESSLFLSYNNYYSKIRIKIYTSSKDYVEGVIEDIRDELVLKNKNNEIYIPWDNILYFETFNTSADKDDDSNLFIGNLS